MSKEKENGAVSLTKTILGVDGRELRWSDDGNGNGAPLTMRKVLVTSLINGADAARQKNDLSADEQFDCYMLAKKISDEQRTGYTFASKEVQLLRKLGSYALRTEAYGALVESIDPGAIKEG